MERSLVLMSLLALSVPALSGCLSDAGDRPDFEAIEAAIGTFDLASLDEGGVIQIGAHNIERLALTNGREDGSKPPTEGYWQTAIKGDYAYLTRNGPEAGLVIFDISDLANPKQVGFVGLHAGFEPDVEISEDEQWAFWETQRFPTSAEVPVVPDAGANLQRGVHIIDISDKTSPQWVGYSPTLPDGPHSITYANIDGRHIVLQSVYAFAYAYADLAVPGLQRLVISELDASTPVASLTDLAEYILPEAEGNLGQMPHDVAVQKHPITGQWLAYISYWDQGVVIIDITDPAVPTFVGKANDFGPAGYGAIHMARPFETLIAGRHITVAEPEISGEPDSGYLTFFDTTDPTAPFYFSSWKIPGESDSGGGSWGPHYFDVRNGRVAIAHYRAGFWVIDVHDEANLLDPKTVGHIQVDTVGTGGGLPVVGLAGNSNSFDAWWIDDRHFVGGDMQGGLGIFQYTGPAPAVVTSA